MFFYFLPSLNFFYPKIAELKVICDLKIVIYYQQKTEPHS
jgi:hypothetical protein